MATLLALGATGCALVWLRGGSPLTVAGSVALLVASLLTVEVAVPAVPFLAALFVYAGWRQSKRRVAILLVAWGIVLVPIATIEWAFLRDPKSYAAVAVLPLSAGAYATRTLSLWMTNFTPWSWAFARPLWYGYSGAVIPPLWMAAGAAFAAAIFLLRLHPKEHGSGHDTRRALHLAALFAVMALVANAAYALVQFSDVHYRTHILSRVWASASIGILAGVAAQMPLLRWPATAAVTAFVCLGVWGGMERQDFFLGTWRRHQRELASILTAAPAIRPGTVVILRGTARAGRLLATEADYLGHHWLRLLYSDPRLPTLRLDPARGSGCRAEEVGVACWREGKADCVASGGCEPARFAYDAMIVLDYDPRSETYNLVRSLRDDPLGRGAPGGSDRYHPEDRIVAQPWTARQRHLILAGPE
jgi:hypothetical protein